jgi:ABC-type phosphate transport system substrate-binding protein
MAHADDPLDLLIVANFDVPERSLTQAELHQIFLKVRTNWSNGKSIVPVNQPSGSEGRAEFLQRILGMNESQEKRYWEEQKVRKGVTPPPVFANVAKAVFRLSGSISYVYRKDYLEGVSRVVLVLPATAR